MLDVDEIRAFLAVAELGGFTRAAGALHRSQPAISRRITLLEQALGAPLLDRDPGGVRLTEAGRAFLPHAEAALAALQDGRDAVRSVLGGEGGRLSLALVGTLADTQIVAMLRAFAQQARDVQIDLRTATSREVSDLVRRGEVTLGLRYFPDASAQLTARTIGAEALVVVAPADHPLTGQALSDMRALADERWVGFPAAGAEPESFGRILERQLAAAGLHDAEVTPVDSLTAQKRLVEAGLGLALLPESSIREELRLGTLAALDAPALQTTVPVAVIHRKDGFLSAAARALLELIGGAAPDGAPAPGEADTR